MNSAPRQGCREQSQRGNINRDQVGVDDQGGNFEGLLKEGVPASEVGGRVAIEPLHISGGADFERAADIDVKESVSPNNIADHAAVIAEGGDETADHDRPGISNQGGGFSSTAEVLGPVVEGEPKTTSQASPQDVTIKRSRQDP